MEGIFFLADIILMLLLCVSIFRGERKDTPTTLGLFGYKPDEKEEEKLKQSTEEGRRA